MPPKLPQKQTEIMPQGRETHVQGVDFTQRQAMKDAQDRRASLSSLISMADELHKDAQESFKKSRVHIRSIQEMDTSARDAANKSAAQDIVMRAKMGLDADLQKLEFDPNVKPLDMHQKASELIKQSANLAVGEATELGSEMQTYVRQKLQDYEFEQVPKYRRMGWDKEQSRVVSSLDDRMYERKVALGERGLSHAKRKEIISEGIADVASLKGTFLSDEDAQKRIDHLRDDFKKQAVLDMAEYDHVGAIRAADELPLLPEERLALKSQVYSITNQKNAEKDRLEAAEEKRRNKRAEEVENEFIRRINASGFRYNPRADLANPEIAAALVTGDRARAIQSYYDRMSGEEAARNRPQKMVNPVADYIPLVMEIYKNRPTPMQVGQHLMEHYTGSDLGPGQVDAAMALAKNLTEQTESEDKAQFNAHKSAGEKIIKDLASRPTGRDARKNNQFALEWNSADAFVTARYNERIYEDWNKAKEQGIDPRVAVDPTSIAFEVMAEALPMYNSIYAKNADKINHAELRGYVGGMIGLQQKDSQSIEMLKGKVSELMGQGKLSTQDARRAVSMVKWLEATSKIPVNQAQQAGTMTQQAPVQIEPAKQEPVPESQQSVIPSGRNTGAKRKTQNAPKAPQSIMLKPPKSGDASESPEEARQRRNANRGLFGTR